MTEHATMAGVVALCVTHRGTDPRTQGLLGELAARGAEVRVLSGASDIGLSRSAAITPAVLGSAKAKHDVLLLVDDDMIANAQHVAHLCSRTRLMGGARSGVYCTSDGRLAATRMASGLYMCGLGMMAVRMDKMLEVGQGLEPCLAPDGKWIVPYCVSGPVPTPQGLRWVSEDYYLCLRLGGVVLDADCPAGHLKLVPLWPDSESLDRIARGDELPSASDPKLSNPNLIEVPDVTA